MDLIKPSLRIKTVAQVVWNHCSDPDLRMTAPRSLFRGIAVAKRRAMKTWLPLLLITVLLAAAEGFAGAQQTTKVPRIGFLEVADPSFHFFEAFRQGLREGGYIEGQNIIIEPRFAYENDWRLDTLAADLVRLQVDVIVARHPAALRAAMGATKTIPIVMTYSGDPVAAVIVATLEQPGGNVTGIGGLSAGLGGKWLELLKEVVPGVSRVGVLYTRFSERQSPMMKELEVAARSLRIELQPADAQAEFFPGKGDRGRTVGAAFTSATRGQAEALIVLPALVFDQNPGYVADLARQRRIPTIFSREGFAEVGGLMAYGANRVEQVRRAAYVADKILKGAKPAELPVELPKKFELVINLKTAKEIGVKIPDKMLTWADRIIK
jgi:putative ABC transport system substrate-binding protein